MLSNPHNLSLLTCSASTTASNSHRRDFLGENPDFFQGEVMCDWLSFRHDFDVSNPTTCIESGKTLKLTQDGEIEWEKQDFSVIRCPSSDTSIRIKCDGAHLWFQGNIGRFQETDNEKGLTVIQCFEKALNVIKNVYPDIDTRLFGSIQRQGTISEYGTYITRLDLNSNFYTDNYLMLSQILSTRRIGQRVARVGKYGPTWGYDSKRGQYWKAKLYDKLAELNGKRTPNTHETTARFEVQLGSEYLRQNGLNHLMNWREQMKTENIIYGKFAHAVMREQATLDSFVDFPAKLRQHAIMYRDGTDPKTYLSRAQYYKVRTALLEHGLDISLPCNVETLKQAVKVITVGYAPTLRKAA